MFRLEQDFRYGQVIVNTDLITVTDVYSRYVTGLNKHAFTILDIKEPQQITFFSDEDAPVSVDVIFDVSGSMSGVKVTPPRGLPRLFVRSKEGYFATAHPR